MKIALVNDVPLALEILKRVVLEDQEHEIIWTAANGLEAVELCARELPDLILMDLVMPEMDGAEATRIIMEQTPTAVLVVTASVKTNGDLVYEALGHGALDAAVTPHRGPEGGLLGADSLKRKIQEIAIITGKGSGLKRGKPIFERSQRLPGKETWPPMVAVGTSTGGPQALATILGALPDDFGATMVIVQHVDADFAPGLARWLNERTVLPVLMAEAGEAPQAGQVYLAGRNQHLKLNKWGRFYYDDEPADLVNRPSVDVLFESLAQDWPRKGVGLLLTGMGKDGAQGLLSLKAAGWHTLAQNEETCVVYGMPKAAVALRAAHESLPLQKIAPALANFAAAT